MSQSHLSRSLSATLAQCCAILVMTAALIPTADAQVLYGTMVGTITDPSGAVVANAQVRLFNEGTGTSNETITSDAGLYTFQNIIAGTYDLTVTSAGFKAFTAQGIVVNANNLQRRDVAMEIGQTGDSVKVEAQALTLQSDRADVSTELTAKEVAEIPLGQYRNYQSLELLVPGATPPRFQNARTDTPQRTLTTNINGTDRQSNTTKIDGAISMNIAIPAQNAYIPGADTIEAVNIVTNAFDAEQGGAGGAAITVTTKSGTNQFHGAAFWNHQNSIVGARDFFYQGDRTPKQLLNIGGFTVGGPIKKDKLFYFLGFETNRERANVGNLLTLPTAAQRAGNFSAYPSLIYDPQTGDSTGRGRTPFAGNIVPLNRQDPIALKLQSLLPATNLPGNTQNFFSSGQDLSNRDQWDIKVNYNREKLRIFGKYSVMNALTAGKGALGNGKAPGGACNCSGGAGEGDTLVQTATLGQTYIFSPTMVYDGSENFTRMGLRTFPELSGTNFGSDVLGIPGLNGPTLWESGMPVFLISGYATLGDRDPWNPVFRKDQTPTISQNLSWVKGKHDMRMGFDGLQFRLNYGQGGTGGPKGTVNWTGGATQLNGGPSATQYNAYAQFLLGAPSTYQKAVQWENYTGYEPQYGLYFRDRWQMSSKLTVTYGLRWEKYPLYTRAGGRPGIELWNPATNVMTLGGQGGNSKDLGVTTSNKLFAPRMGIAYRLNEKTVVRTGYGISIDPASVARQNNLYPLNVGSTFQPANSFLTYSPLAVGIPRVVGPAPGSPTVLVPGGVTLSVLGPNFFKRGYIQSWNFIVERQLPGAFLVSVGYVGTTSTNERFRQELNAAQPGTGTAGLPFFAPFGRTASTTILTAGLSTNYHSLQATVNRRVASSMTLKGAFTYSKAMDRIDDAGTIPNITLNNMRDRNYAAAAFNQTLVYSTAIVYTPPFGKGQKYFSTGVPSKVLGGWQFNSIASAFTGRPFSVTAPATSLNAPNATTGLLPQTANQIKDHVEKIGTVDQWYDRSAFAAVTTATFGNTKRNILYGPGVINFDASIFRDFTVTERIKLQFRVEGFNIANTPHFSPPNGQTTPNNPPITNVTASDFMKITSTLGPLGQGKDAPARYFRAGLRVTW